MSCTSENYFLPALTNHILLNYTGNLVDTCFVNQNLNFTRTTDQRWSWTIRDFSGSVKHLVLKDIFPRRTPPTGTSAWYIARHSEFASKSSVNPARHIGIAQTFLFPFELFPDVRFSFDFFYLAGTKVLPSAIQASAFRIRLAHWLRIEHVRWVPYAYSVV